jgi:hypothetical protein
LTARELAICIVIGSVAYFTALGVGTVLVWSLVELLGQ